MTDKTVSSTVLSALRRGPLREPAHVWLYEVRNETGYGSKRQRYADALVVSVWPSRGIWFAGIEVKVDRRDWLRELDDPTKAQAIQQYCDYWWVAAPPGIVNIDEVPEKWGYYEVDGKMARALKNAPRLEPQPLTREFVASVFRNEADSMAKAKQVGRDEGRAETTAEFGAERIEAMQNELNAANRANLEAQQRARHVEYDLSNMKQRVATFEQGAGLPQGTIQQCAVGGLAGKRIGEQFVAAQLLADLPPKALAKRFADVAAALEALEKQP